MSYYLSNINAVADIPWPSPCGRLGLADLPFGPARFTGFVSHLGALGWCAAAAICLFSSRLLARGGDAELARFNLWAGLLSMALLVDDLFMFDESVQPWLSERWIYAGYGLLL